MGAWRAVRSSDCVQCGFCESMVYCPDGEALCKGCGNCVKGCPTGAKKLVPRNDAPEVTVTIDGEAHRVAERTPLSRVLTALGKGLGAGNDCGTGGCWACGVRVNGVFSRACSTGAAEGLEVETRADALKGEEPRRIVSFFPDHLHASMSLFTHGCNFSCDFCHNWNLSFGSAGKALTPKEAVDMTRRLTAAKGNRRTGISGGEPTMNRRWLVEYIDNLRATTRGVRIQVDTNASFLTPDYIDELWEAGMTDFSPDLKALEVDTFRRISGLDDREVAARLLETSWKAVEYALSRYGDRLHITVAIPYHPLFITGDEVRAMGERLAALKAGLDVNLIVYQPAFRQAKAGAPTDEQIDAVLEGLEATGVTAWCQEGEDIPLAVTPEDCVPRSSEEW